MLDRIVSHKRQEIQALKEKVPEEQLHRKLGDLTRPDFTRAISRDGIQIIAEIKYRSPSHGPFSIQWPPEDIADAYRDGGAAAISVLTDQRFFGGDGGFLEKLSKRVEDVPLLRKDFIIDRYQILEARILGSSAFLLIVGCLSDSELRSLSEYGLAHQLQPLVEVHDLFELDRAIATGSRVIGVNNRNLKTFDVDIRTSFQLARRVEGEDGFTLVSESGLSEHSQLAELRDAGFSAFLIGSTLMDAEDPGRMLRELRGEN